jgi:hypothetical protein
MHERWLVSCALVALVAGVGLDAGAQPFPGMPAPPPCVAKRGPQADARLAEKIAAADRSIESRKPGAWTVLADLAQYACAVAGDRLPVDAAFQRCIRECADERDVYFARVLYAQALERFGDLLGAENQYLNALQSSEDPHRAYMAHHGYATMLERHGRTRDALDVLNRFAGEWSYRSPTMQLKLSLMRELGMDTRAEEEAAKRRSDADLALARLDAPPMSAIPVERNPLAQLAFGRTIEVVGNAWIEPVADGGGPGPGRLYYRSASMPDRDSFARKVALEPGQRFLVVADLGASGCRVAVGDARYDLEECPWRSGRADAALFRVVAERTPVPPAVSIQPRPPLPVGPTPQSEPAPAWSVWAQMYSAFATFEERGSTAYAEAILEHAAGLAPAEAAQVRAAGREYTKQLERMDADARRQIAERFSPPSATQQPSRDPSPPLVIDGDRLPDGKSLREVLDEEGFISRLDAQKDALLRAHLADLGGAIGIDKVSSLERVVREQIAPGVRTVTRAGPPSARPAGL